MPQAPNASRNLSPSDPSSLTFTKLNEVLLAEATTNAGTSLRADAPQWTLWLDTSDETAPLLKLKTTANAGDQGQKITDVRGGAPIVINDISNVNIGTDATGDILVSDGSDYENRTFTSMIVAGANVTKTTSASGVVTLAASGGGGGGSSTFASLTDVDLDSLAQGHVLHYDDANDEWVNGSIGDRIKGGTGISASVDTNGIMTLAVEGSGLLPNSVTSVELDNGSVGSVELKPEAVSTSRLANGAVESEKINATGAAANRYLRLGSDGTSLVWATGVGTGISTIAAASDTGISSPSQNQVLAWDGSDSFDNVGISSLISAGTNITKTDNSDGTITLASTASGGGGGASVAIQVDPPASPSDGDLWIDADDSRLYAYYNDGTDSQWIETAGASPVIADGSVTSGSIASGAVTLAKLAAGSATSGQVLTATSSGMDWTTPDSGGASFDVQSFTSAGGGSYTNGPWTNTFSISADSGRIWFYALPWAFTAGSNGRRARFSVDVYDGTSWHNLFTNSTNNFSGRSHS